MVCSFCLKRVPTRRAGFLGLTALLLSTGIAVAAELAETKKGKAQRQTARVPDAEQEVVRTVRTLNCVGVTDMGVTDMELKEQLKGLKELHTLSLINCPGVTDAGLKGIKELKGLKELRALSLVNCAGVTDAGLKELKGLKGLRSLVLVGTKVTDAGVAELKKALPELAVEWRKE
jgi:hypothetical protein